MKEIKINISDEAYENLKSELKSIQKVFPDTKLEQLIVDIIDIHIKTKNDLETFNQGFADLFGNPGQQPPEMHEMMAKFMEAMGGSFNPTAAPKKPAKTAKKTTKSDSKKDADLNNDDNDFDPRAKYRS